MRRQTPLFRTCIIGEWLSGKGRTVPLTMEEIVRSTLVQQYIPVKNANVDTFLALSDDLNEGEENSELLTYLSTLKYEILEYIRLESFFISFDMFIFLCT